MYTGSSLLIVEHSQHPQLVRFEPGEKKKKNASCFHLNNTKNDTAVTRRTMSNKTEVVGAFDPQLLHYTEY